MAAYPSEYELDVVLRDGGVVHVRPMRPDDAAEARTFFQSLGPESRYFRFFAVKVDLTEDEVRHFADIDYDDRMSLVAIDGGRIVGVGRYDRESPGADVAEVAFAVVDSHQGRGIGTRLLDLLTDHARSNGVNQFRAYVLGENRQMMRVFRNSGYELTRTIDQGVFTVDFPVEVSSESAEAQAVHERRAVAASLLPFFFPKSIAVIGASTDATSIGGRLFRNLMDAGFTGPIYPVNPGAKVVRSVKAYPTVLEIPDEVDVAYIVVPQRFVHEVVAQCGEKGVRGVVVISAGFAEVGPEGAAREAELLRLVRSMGMRMVGPNCMGLLNTADAVRLNGTFAPVYPPAGNVAMSSQSGALGIAILDYATEHSIGISQFVSVGNKADVSANDLLLAWEDDPATDVITLYVESFGNPRKFSRIARRIARRKPIIAVKSGRTQAGIKAASSHTGALASSDVAVATLFRQAGVIRVDTMVELFDTASILANQPVPKGSRVGIVTNAGGPGILAADALEANELVIAELSTDLRDRIGAALPEEASTANPIDMIASGGPDHYQHVVSELLASGEVDAVMVIYVPTTPEGAEQIAAALRRCQDQYEGDVTLISVFMHYARTEELLTGGEGDRAIPSYSFPESAALALTRAVGYGQWRKKDPGVEARLEPESAERIREVVDQALERLGPSGGWLESNEVEAILEGSGLRFPRSVVAHTAEAARTAATDLGGPLVVKVIAPSALHKSDVGGVILGVRGADETAEAFEKVTSTVADPQGALIQEFVPGGHEVLIGMTQDPNFGPLVAFGLGGVYVELLKDVAFRIHPLTDVDAAEMIRETKGHRLLEGYRNQALGDLAALETALLRVSGLITAVPELAEMDLNPVKVLEPGDGVVVVDARMRIEPVSTSGVRDLAAVASRIPAS